MRYILVVFFVFISISTDAWNARGHMIIAAIAYHNLSVEKQKVFTDILKQHPEYEVKWKADFSSLDDDVELGLYLFMQASVWPDKIRGSNHPSHKYDAPKWHYMNYELRFPYNGEQKVVDDDNVLEAIGLNMEMLNSTNTSKEKKAIALCWLIHMVGDIHQPLHSVSLYSEQYPKGDRGGNLFWIKPKGSIKLHAYWDGLLGKSTKVSSVLNEANTLYQQTEIEVIMHDSPGLWGLESFRLAREKVYLNGELKGGISKKDAPSVPVDYGTNSKEIGEQRVVQAGYRLAGIFVRFK